MQKRSILALKLPASFIPVVLKFIMYDGTVYSTKFGKTHFFCRTLYTGAAIKNDTHALLSETIFTTKSACVL
jgi:hypothetical protein